MFVSWNVDPDSNKISKARLSVLRIDGLKHLLSLSLGFRDDPIFVWPYIPNSTDIDLRWMQLHKGANFRTDATCEANEFWSLVWFQRLTLWGELPKKHDGNMAKQQNVSVIRPYMNAFGWHGSSRPSKVQGNLRPIWPVVGFSADPSTWPYIIWTYVITQGNSEMDCTPPGMYKTLYNSGIYLPSSTGFLAGMFWTIQPVCQPRQILRLTCDVWRYDQLQETLRTWLKSEDRKKKKNTWRWILDGGTTFPSPPVVPVKGTNVVDSRVFVQILQAQWEYVVCSLFGCVKDGMMCFQPWLKECVRMHYLWFIHTVFAHMFHSFRIYELFVCTYMQLYDMNWAHWQLCSPCCALYASRYSVCCHEKKLVPFCGFRTQTPQLHFSGTTGSDRSRH